MSKRRKGKKSANRHNTPSRNVRSQNGQPNAPTPAALSRPVAVQNENPIAKKSQAQERALHALAKIDTLAKLPGSDRGKYVSYVKALPANIFMSGLGQAMAMEKASHMYDGHWYLFNHVQSWLCNDCGNGWKTSPYKHSTDLVRAICCGSQCDYVRAQAEALEYLNWLKKFAVAYLTETNETEPSDDNAATS